MYSIQLYVITFLGDLRQVCGFLRVPRLSPTNKTDRHDITELLKVALNTITLNQPLKYTGIIPCLPTILQKWLMIFT